MELIFILFLLYVYLKIKNPHKLEHFTHKLPQGFLDDIVDQLTDFKYNSKEQKCLPIQGNVGVIIEKAMKFC
jgi:hypothetical protein